MHLLEICSLFYIPQLRDFFKYRLFMDFKTYSLWRYWIIIFKWELLFSAMSCRAFLLNQIYTIQNISTAILRLMNCSSQVYFKPINIADIGRYSQYTNFYRNWKFFTNCLYQKIVVFKYKASIYVYNLHAYFTNLNLN